MLWWRPRPRAPRVPTPSPLPPRLPSFKNCIIILTSNLGSQAILEMGDADPEGAKAAVMAMLKTHFRPEFLNRLDDFVVFDGLKRDQIATIVRMQVRRVQGRLAAKKIGLDLDDAAVDHLAALGFDPVFGARPVKRAVQRELETGLAKALLRGDFGEEDEVKVSAANGALTFDVVKGGYVAPGTGDGAVPAEAAVPA